MIDLTSKDYTYTNLKVLDIQRKLKEIKSDMIELTSSDVINIALIIFSYLIEGDFFDNDEDNLKLDLYNDIMLINLEDTTLQLKFKNNFINHVIDEDDNEYLFKNMDTVKELLVGDDV